MVTACKTRANARAAEFILKLLAFQSICACAAALQQPHHHNVLYSTHPLIYRPKNESPRWRNFNPQPFRVPLSAAYYATPAPPPPAPYPHTHAQFHLAPPNRYFATPYQTAAYYGSEYTATTTPITTSLEDINPVPQQQLNIQRQRQPQPQPQLQTQHQTQHQHQHPSQRQLQRDQQPRIAPEIVQQHRNEGNFYRGLATASNATSKAAQRKHAQEFPRPPFVRSSSKAGHTGYAAFEHKVLHVTTERIPTVERDNRKRRSFPFENVKSRETKDIDQNHDDDDKHSNEGPSQEMPHKTKFFHDIFMHYADPQSIAYGHVERQPLHFAKRFESMNKGNRYRGEVTWADMKTGGYGAHQWDLAQGAL